MDKRRRHAPSSGAVRGRVLAGTGLSLGAALGVGASAEAATVINTNDAGPGSLRAAVLNTNGTPDDTITFNSGLSGTITLTSGQIVIQDGVQINGPGRGSVTVRGNGATRLIVANLGTYGGAIGTPGEAVTISGLTLTGGVEGGSDGGAILNENAALTVAESVVSGNGASGDGGGIFGSGFVTILNSTISGNTAGDDGGGVFSNAGGMTIANSTISGNTASASGVAYGGGVYSSSGGVTITNSTIAANTASRGGGIFRAVGTLNLQNTIVADNSATFGRDLYGLFAGNFAFVETVGSLTPVTPGSNIVGQDPQLGPLANNGGATPTRALSKTSPALDMGRSFGFKTDQRSQRRPFNLLAIPNSKAAGADGSDMGAVEQSVKCKKTKKKKGKKGAFAAAKKKPKQPKQCKKKKKK